MKQEFNYFDKHFSFFQKMGLGFRLPANDTIIQMAEIVPKKIFTQFSALSVLVRDIRKSAPSHGAQL